MTTKQRERYWQQVINEWQHSGLSGMAFCKQQEYPYHRFTYWRAKLRSEAPEKTEAQAGFARVTKVGRIDDTQPELTVTLPSGISISGLHAGNLALLGAILRQL